MIIDIPYILCRFTFKVAIPIYKGYIELERLHNWIDVFETYYIVYKSSNAHKIKFAGLKLSRQALTWWKSYQRWYDVSN